MSSVAYLRTLSSRGTLKIKRERGKREVLMKSYSDQLTRGPTPCAPYRRHKINQNVYGVI